MLGQLKTSNRPKRSKKSNKPIRIVLGYESETLAGKLFAWHVAVEILGRRQIRSGSILTVLPRKEKGDCYPFGSSADRFKIPEQFRLLKRVQPYPLNHLPEELRSLPCWTFRMLHRGSRARSNGRSTLKDDSELINPNFF